MNTARRHSKGFTLIELMIVVVVIAILASIAIPAYNNYVLQSRRADAQSQLLELQSRQERWRINNPAYTSDPNDLGGGPTNNFYTFSIPVSSTTGYTLRAAVIPGSAQAGDSGCSPLTLDQAGNRTPPDCWRR